MQVEGARTLLEETKAAAETQQKRLEEELSSARARYISLHTWSSMLAVAAYSPGPLPLLTSRYGRWLRVCSVADVTEQNRLLHNQLDTTTLQAMRIQQRGTAVGTAAGDSGVSPTDAEKSLEELRQVVRR